MNDYNKYLGKIAITIDQFEGLPEGVIVKIVAVLTGSSKFWVWGRYSLAVTFPKKYRSASKHSISNHLWDDWKFEYKVLDGINPDLKEYYYTNPDHIKIIGN